MVPGARLRQQWAAARQQGRPWVRPTTWAESHRLTLPSTGPGGGRIPERGGFPRADDMDLAQPLAGEEHKTPGL